MLSQDPGLGQGHAAVEGGLAAEGEQDAVRLLPGDDRLDESGRHGQEVDLVGQMFRSLDGGDIGIDQDDFQALFLEGLDGLAAAVIEFPGFADLEGPAAEKDDLADAAARLPFCRRRLHGRLSRKRSKRKSVSVGPGAASGWNCTLWKGLRMWRMPSFVPSLAFVNQGFQPGGRVRVSTAKP